MKEEMRNPIFENNPLPIFIYDRETLYFLDVNSSACVLYGYTRDEFLNMQITGLKPPEEVPLLTKFLSSINSESGKYSDIRHKKKDGSIVITEIFFHELIYNDKAARSVVVNDITESRRTELENKENQRKLSTLISNLQGFVYRCMNDEHWTMEFISEGCFELAGYRPDDLINNKKISYNEIIYHEDRAFVFEEVQKAVNRREPYQITYRIKTASDEIKWVGEKGRAVFSENNKILALEGFITDITKVKNYQAELIEAKEKAEEMNHLKSVFLANMSHELRTPLIGILGYAEMILNELKETHYSEMLTELLFSTNQLKDTIDSILDLSKIEAENIDVKFTEIDISKLLPEIIKLFYNPSLAKGLSLKTIIEDGDLLVKGDFNLFTSIVKNLLNNAVKFTNKGEVSVKLKKVLYQGNWYAKLDVIDTGTGIPESAQEKIFEPFRQANEGLARPFDGIGLGLTITRKFVHLLKGKIEVQSTVGEGSTFTVKFPLSSKFQGNNNNHEAAIIKQLPVNGKKKIHKLLLVENDIPTIGMIQMFLKDRYDLDYATDGDTAIKLAGSNKYEAVLMDIALGFGINGIQAAKKIISLPGYSEIPMIAVTAYAMAGDKEYLLSQCFTHYLAKPFDKTSINKFLNRILA
ncbi:MAG: ATP-binding protein [Ignavibacteria bacterium]